MKRGSPPALFDIFQGHPFIQGINSICQSTILDIVLFTTQVGKLSVVYIVVDILFFVAYQS